MYMNFLKVNNRKMILIAQTRLVEEVVYNSTYMYIISL